MSKKFKIKQNPTFKAKVVIPVVGGDGVETEFEFKYLTRKELAAMYDKWSDEAKKLTFEDVTLAELTDQEMNLQVMQIKDIVCGWDIEEEFKDENIEGLVNISINIVKAITDVYQKAYVESKLGN